MKYSHLAMTLLATAMPFTSSAATLTPQQLLDRSYISWNTQQSNASTFQFEMKSWTKYLRTPTYRSPEYEVKFNMSSERYLRNDSLSDGTMRMQLPLLKYKDTNETIELRDPIAFEARAIGMDFYFRVSALSDQVRGYLGTLDSETRNKIDGLVGQWVHVNITDLANQQATSTLPFQMNDLQQDREKYAALVRELRAAKIIRVTGVEKRYRGPDGHKMIRVRATLNPKVVDILFNWIERERVASVLPSTSSISSGFSITDKKERAKTIKEAKKFLSHIKLAAVLDQTDGSLDRVELAFAYTYPKNTTKWVKNRVITQREGTTHLNLKMGTELRAIANRSVEAPAGSISLEEFMARWESPRLAPIEEPASPEPSAFENFFLSDLGQYPQTMTARDHVRGNPEGPIAMVVYSDFQCPACQVSDGLVRRALAEFPQDVKYVYRHYPLNYHAFSMSASEASECAGRVGGSNAFWTMHDAIYAESQSGFSSSTWLTFARNQGLDEASFQACMENHETLDKINEDIFAANASALAGTPQVYINGAMLNWTDSYETLKSALQSVGAQH